MNNDKRFNCNENVVHVRIAYMFAQFAELYKASIEEFKIFE